MWHLNNSTAHDWLGDLVVFSHTLFHAVFCKGEPERPLNPRTPRRYLALKYAEAPRTAAQKETLT